MAWNWRRPQRDGKALTTDGAPSRRRPEGIEGLRTRDIAERVGINVATLHYHVPSKAALIGIVAETLRHDFRAQSQARPRAHLTPREQLDHEFHDFAELYFERQDMLAVLSEMMERGRRDPMVKAALMPLMARWREMVAEGDLSRRHRGRFLP